MTSVITPNRVEVAHRLLTGPERSFMQKVEIPSEASCGKAIPSETCLSLAKDCHNTLYKLNLRTVQRIEPSETMAKIRLDVLRGPGSEQRLDHLHGVLLHCPIQGSFA